MFSTVGIFLLGLDWTWSFVFKGHHLFESLSLIEFMFCVLLIVSEEPKF